MKKNLLFLTSLLILLGCESKIEDCNDSTIQKIISKMIANNYPTFSKIKLSDIELIVEKENQTLCQAKLSWRNKSDNYSEIIYYKITLDEVEIIEEPKEAAVKKLMDMAAKSPYNIQVIQSDASKNKKNSNGK